MDTVKQNPNGIEIDTGDGKILFTYEQVMFLRDRLFPYSEELTVKSILDNWHKIWGVQ